MSDAERAKASWNEFVGPCFQVVRAGYAVGLAEYAARCPEDTKRITKLAQAIKVLDDVESQMMAIIAQGVVAENDAKRAQQIAKIRPSMRQLIGLE